MERTSQPAAPTRFGVVDPGMMFRRGFTATAMTKLGLSVFDLVACRRVSHPGSQHQKKPTFRMK
jgi:hypothetical protein